MGIIAELRRRNVFRVGIAYVALGWVVIEVTDTVAPALGMPDWTLTVVTWFGIIGLPFALLLAWAFELTPEGIKREHEVDRSESITHSTGRKLDFAIIGLLAIALSFVVWDSYLSGPTQTTVVAAPPGASVEPEPEVKSLAADPSIAVLPFVNMSSDPEQEYFSDGLSEEILNLLAKIPELKVIGRTSSFAFKGKNEDLRVIGQALDVSTVLEGSVRKSGERVRITAQLIDVADGAHIWSETYDRTMTDVFEVQDSVAAEIIGALKLHVGVLPERGLPTTDSVAYTAFLKARALLNNWATQESIDLLKGVVERDPEFAEAYELLAYCYWLSAGVIVKSHEGQRLTTETARKALQLNPDLLLARSLHASGDIETYSFLGEIQGLELAARLEPGKTASFDMLAYDLIEAGYLRESLAVARQFVTLDPLSAAAHWRLHEALYAVGRIDEALAALETAGELGAWYAAYALAIHFAAEGQDDLAISHLASWMEKVNLQPAMAHDLVKGARDRNTGAAHLDEQIQRILEAAEDRHRRDLTRLFANFYGIFGHLDRHFDNILSIDMDASTWTDADDLVFTGHVMLKEKFFTHPKYLEVVERIGIIDLWEKRGAPDFCSPQREGWNCG